MSRRHCFGGKQLRVQEGSHRATRCALSPSPPCESVPAGIHGCPQGVAPIGHHIASRDTLVTAHGEETTQALHIPRDAMHTCLSSFRLLALASPHLDARQKHLI